MQFYGNTYRETGIEEGLFLDKLTGECSGESSIVALQKTPFKLIDQENHKICFVATYLPNHELATSDDDLLKLSSLFDEFDHSLSPKAVNGFVMPKNNIFNSSVFLPVDDLNHNELDQFFGTERRHCEKENGKLLSFFYKENTHVVLRAKEIKVDRPHGNIMQAKAELVPDEIYCFNNVLLFWGI